MYVALMLALLAAAGGAIVFGLTRQRRAPLVLGAVLLAGTGLLFALLDLWVEVRWFRALGQAGRFWTEAETRALTVLGGAALAAALAWLFTLPVRGRPWTRDWPEAASALIGALWGWGVWDEWLLFRNGGSFGMREPILGLDASFYVFTLPFLDQVFALLIWVTVISALATLLPTFVRRIDAAGEIELHPPGDPSALRPLERFSAVLAGVVAVGVVLSLAHLLHAEGGVVAGPGWTDVHVRVPAHVVVIVLTLGLAALPLLGRSGLRVGRRLAPANARLGRLGGVWLGVLGVLVLGLFAAPRLVQWLVVEPNEITLERPYIAHNIEFTRHGFGLDDVEQRQLPMDQELTRELTEQYDDLLSEVRLWDYRALMSVYEQFQEIRLYYEFDDVDLDRYRFGDRYRQVIVSAREMEQDNLPPQSRTFVNHRFKYTHGYGVTMATVSDFTSEGLPNLLVKDIPPVAEYPELEVERPEIYYGELTDEPVVVNSSEREFDHPRGDTNAYTRYAGDGGVRLGGLWNKFAFGWRLDGTRFLLSSYPRPESRVMMYRNVRERVARLAPFLELDREPYIALVDGELHWILDAYTTSDQFPYSEPFTSRELVTPADGRQRPHVVTGSGPQLRGTRYVRNSVKAVVDAYDGSVELYVFDPDDPVVRAWRRVFPGLFRDREQMPDGLRAHVRYPIDYLLAQGLVYAKYHMTDPEVFYNQEDLWVRATEKYRAGVQPVEPYYVMWELPDSDGAEFMLMLPFTPKQRQVLIGWIAGLCDGEDYGRFVAYQFPKEQRVLGPQQVETKIDQDATLSQRLTLWDQRGSSVIRGNMLAYPIGDTLLYVEPVYLRAETAAYPELRLVVVMHDDRMSYGTSFDEALAGLFGEGSGTTGETGTPTGPAPPKELIDHAGTAFDDYLDALGERDFAAAAEALDRLQRALDQLESERDG